MQNLARCANRHYASVKHSFGLPAKSYLRQYAILSRRLGYRNSDNNANRLLFPVSEYVYNKLHNELVALQILLLRYDLHRNSNQRNFFTESPKRNDKHDGNKGASDQNPKKDPKKDPMEQILFMQKILVSLLLFYVGISLLTSSSRTKAREHTVISWNEFIHHILAKGEVESVIVNTLTRHVTISVHHGAIIKGRRAASKYYFVSVPDVSTVEQKIREVEQSLGIGYDDRVPISYVRRGEYFMLILNFVIIGALALSFLNLLRRNNFPMSFQAFKNITKAQFTLVEPFTSKGVKFEDVAGLKNAKTEVMEFVDYLKHPTRYKTLGAKMPKGILLLGPPGCGKTMLAKAVATESNVPFLSMNGSEFIEMLGGLGAARVRNLFQEGKKRAPSIIYIDEIDAIGKKRFEGGSGSSESDRTLNQLLVEMDGMGTNTNVIVLASTNRDEVLDKALLRPGRFDRQITIEMPTHEERKLIFESHLKSLVLKHPPSTYSDYLASFTPGFSGADIANVCNEAALHAARYSKKQVDRDDLSYAIDRVVGGMVKKTAHTPDMKKSIAYYEAGHAVVGWLSKHADPILKVSIVPRTNKRYGYTQHELSEAYLYSKEHIFDKICMLLGGRVAEYIMFNKITIAAEGDLKTVTKLASNQVKLYGMSPILGLVSFPDRGNELPIKGEKLYSKKLGNLIDAEISRIVDEAYKTTQMMLMKNKDKLIAVAEALIERETLSHSDIEQLIGPPVHGRRPSTQSVKLESDTKTESP